MPSHPARPRTCAFPRTASAGAAVCWPSRRLLDATFEVMSKRRIFDAMQFARFFHHILPALIGADHRGEARSARDFRDLAPLSECVERLLYPAQHRHESPAA